MLTPQDFDLIIAALGMFQSSVLQRQDSCFLTSLICLPK
jgi:hypothetical protein